MTGSFPYARLRVRPLLLVLLASFLPGAPLRAGILVAHSDKGFQFADAASVAVNGKEKVFNLGNRPELTGPAKKLPVVRLGGTLLQDAGSKTIALYEDHTVEYLFPEGLAKNDPSNPAAAWVAARISYKKSPSDKTPTDIALPEFVAFLPGGTDELTKLCMDAQALEVIGARGKAFATQLELLAATVKAYPSDTAIAPLKKYVEEAMRRRSAQFESGVAGWEVLEEGLQLADLSQAVYPAQPGHETLRKELRGRKVWLERKAAILRAFMAAGDWDAFLIGYGEVERYRQALPEVAKMEVVALKASLESHQRSGEERLKEQEFGPAFREFRAASLRRPSDNILQQRVLMAWTDYSRQTAIDHQGSRKQLTPGQREAIYHSLLFATRYAEQKKLDAALKSVLEAEAIDPDSLDVLLKKAEILGAQKEFARALATLDEYDLRAVDEEREKARTLRGDLLFKRTSSLEDLKAQMRKAWTEEAYHQVLDLATEGLRAKKDDPELLYGAGRASLIVRHNKDSRAFFTQYLAASATLDADVKQRALVRSLLASVHDTDAPEQGEPNWFSGKKAPANIYYCPVSLAFQTRVDHIEASNKLKVSYDWTGDRIRSITPTFEKIERATGERKISFAYDPHFPQVTSVAYEDGARSFLGSDPDDIYRHSPLLLGNNPYVDPVAIQRLTGNDVAIGISGNRFFNPFVWNGIHYFRLTYDDQGRVSSAREVADPKAAPGDLQLEFDWDGLQLTAVHGYQATGPNQRTEVYERTLQYQEGQLVSEEIRGQGKSSHIKYAYNGNHLVSAVCDKDPTMDDRSRHVTFR